MSLAYLQTYANLLLCSEQNCQNFLFTVRGGGNVINMGMEQNAVDMQKNDLPLHCRTASKHVDKDLGNIEENKKLEENNHKSET